VHTLWTDEETTTAEDDADHDIDDLSRFASPGLEDDLEEDPEEDLEEDPDTKTRSFTLDDAMSTARKTLALVLSRAARLPALGSLLQHKVFMERNTDSFFSKEQEDVARASLKYLEVKLFA